jgi:hypothetical protein
MYNVYTISGHGDKVKRDIDPVEVEKRIRAWADVTMLSIELKRAVIRKRHPELGEDEIGEMMRKEFSMLKIKQEKESLAGR